MTEKEYGDFEVYVDFKMPEAAATAAWPCVPRLRATRPTRAWRSSSSTTWTWPGHFKDLKPAQHTGSIYGVVPPSQEALKPVGEWNTIRITAKGRQVTIELNGTKIVDANLDDHKDAVQAHPGLTRKGHLGLQSHSNRVEFRNIYVKEL